LLMNKGIEFDKSNLGGGQYVMAHHDSPPSRRSEWLLGGSVLALYIVITMLVDRPDLIWDEGRYLKGAANLTKGSFVPQESPDIVNGPGYPLVLAPLLALKMPLLALRLLNSVFMALAVWLGYRAVLPYAGRGWALAVALVTALHPSLLRVAPYLMTESLAVCCAAGFAWAFTAALRGEKTSWFLVLVAALAFGWLTMTRVFFGNVIMASVLLMMLLLPFWRSARSILCRALLVLGLAFVLCVPWLAYTKSKTGDTLCWSTNAGELLYWASSTSHGENGHWFSDVDAINKPELVANGHREFYQAHYYLPVKEREAALKKRAWENLRANPVGAFKNWLCNWGRLVLGWPRSFHAEELLMLVLVAANVPLVLSVCLALAVGCVKWRLIPAEVQLLALMFFIYMGGTSLLPGLPRYTLVVWPWIGLVLATVLSRHLRVRVAD
jgi:4-amino-4-deoxy-L-arabinose transferase-like glycosyltransferase